MVSKRTKNTDYGKVSTYERISVKPCKGIFHYWHTTCILYLLIIKVFEKVSLSAREKEFN